jgi:hypothetical protein
VVLKSRLAECIAGQPNGLLAAEVMLRRSNAVKTKPLIEATHASVGIVAAHGAAVQAGASSTALTHDVAESGSFAGNARFGR